MPTSCAITIMTDRGRIVQEVVGPGLSSLDHGMANNPFKHSWMPYMITSPTLFNATLFTAAVHSEALYKTGPRPDSLVLKSQTINLINKDLQSSLSSISDGTIAASMVIMYTEVYQASQNKS
jgi:hypothetical protein